MEGMMNVADWGCAHYSYKHLGIYNTNINTEKKLNSEYIVPIIYWSNIVHEIKLIYFI